MKFTNTTDKVVWFKRTHRFGEEPALVIGVAPGESLPTSQVHRFEPTAPLPADLPPAEIQVLGNVELTPAPPADPASNDAPPQG